MSSKNKKSAAASSSLLKKKSPEDSMRKPLTPDQQRKINAAAKFLIEKKPLTTKTALSQVRDSMSPAYEKVGAWFDEECAKWTADLTSEEKKDLLEEYRAANKIDENENDDAEDLNAIAATKIDKQRIVEMVELCFGTPPGKNTPPNAVFTVYDPRESNAEENELVKAFAAFPQLNPNARSELEFAGPDSFAVALYEDESTGTEHILTGTPRTYRASTRIPGRVTLSKNGVPGAVANLMKQGQDLGLPQEYHLLDESSSKTRPQQIRDVVAYGPSIAVDCARLLSEKDVADICAFDLRELVGAKADPKAVAVFRSSMRRAYHKVVEAGHICEDESISGSTPEDPLPEDCSLWHLVSSPAFVLLMPTCIWAYNCQVSHTSMASPMYIEDIRAAINRTYQRVEKRAGNSAPMVDDTEPAPAPKPSKPKGKNKASAKHASTIKIEPIEIDFLSALREKMKKRLSVNFASVALRNLRETKGLPSEKAKKDYMDTPEDKLSTLTLNSALCESNLTPQERGYFLAMLNKAGPKLKMQASMARKAAEKDPVIAALFTELSPASVGSNKENTVSVRSITQALITSGMQAGQTACEHAKLQKEKQVAGVLSLVDSLEGVINEINTKIDEANSTIANFEQSERHLTAELSAQGKELAKLRAEPEKLKSELVEAKCKSVKAAEELKKTKSELSASRAEIEELEKKLALLSSENKELKKRPAACAPEKTEDSGELATFLMDDTDIPSKRRDLTKSAAEAESDEKSSDSDSDSDDCDASSAVFGPKSGELKNTASILAQMAGDDPKDDEEEGEEESQLTIADLSRDDSGEPVAERKKRARDEGSFDESSSKLQKKGHSPSRTAVVTHDSEEENDLDAW